MIVLGCDPGESGAIAAVRSVKGLRPHLLGAWSIHGSSHDLWMRRAEDAIDKAHEAVARVGGGGFDMEIYVERVVPVARGPFAHHRTGWGLGWRAGVLCGQLYRELHVLPELIEPSKEGWWGALTMNGRPLGPKRGDGLHRLTEAAMFVEGADAPLRQLVDDATSKAARERVVDAAESILIAASVCYARGGK